MSWQEVQAEFDFEWNCRAIEKLDVKPLSPPTRASVAKMNRRFRETDESHLWPIRNRFNVTERAIKRVQRMQRQGMVISSNYEYYVAVDFEISDIVNDESNW